MLPRGVHSSTTLLGKTTARWLPRSRQDPNANPHAIGDGAIEILPKKKFSGVPFGPIQTPRGDMAVRRRRMQVRRRTAVALGVLAGVVEPPSDVTTLTRRPRIRPRSSTVRPTLVSPPSVNREAAAPYPFRPHDHTHTVSTMLNTAATATVHSLESTERALSLTTTLPAPPTNSFLPPPWTPPVFISEYILSH